MSSIQRLILYKEAIEKLHRKNFQYIKWRMPSKGDEIDQIKQKADEILPNLNSGQANRSIKREIDVKRTDNLAGILAEEACKRFLKAYFGEQNIRKSSWNSSKNQIDIQLGDYTIEVRSSFVRNGIDFALFGRDKNDNGDSYFDVLGPYHNSYKPCEIYKDYYMRVFYEGEKKIL